MGVVPHAEWLRDCPARFRDALSAYAVGALVPDVALLRLLMSAGSATELAEVLASTSAAARDRGAADVAQALERLRDTARRHPEAWQMVSSTLRLVHGSPGQDLANDRAAGAEEAAAGLNAIAALATRFDRAAELCPEASVALYSLGKPERLAVATAEIVLRLRDWGLLGPERRVLDIGCGIGRIEQALAPEVGFITGIDISPKMIELASARCAGKPNVAFELANGRDLGGFADSSLDVILAVDCLPYLVECGEGLVEAHFTEAARVLKPSGQFAIFNFSYRGDLAADRAELGRLARQVGLGIVRNGVQGLRTWDGAGFHLIKQRE